MIYFSNKKKRKSTKLRSAFVIKTIHTSDSIYFNLYSLKQGGCINIYTPFCFVGVWLQVVKHLTLCMVRYDFTYPYCSGFHLFELDFQISVCNLTLWHTSDQKVVAPMMKLHLLENLLWTRVSSGKFRFRSLWKSGLWIQGNTLHTNDPHKQARGTVMTERVVSFV